MKRTILLIAYIALMLYTAAHGDHQCMSYAHDPYAEDADYHELSPIECYCPCRHYKIVTHGQCTYCGHYRYPSTWDIVTIKRKKQLSENLAQARKDQQIPANVQNPRLYKIFGRTYAVPEQDN